MATINDLTALTTPTENDLLAIWDAEAGSGVEPTKKITAKNLATGLSEIGLLNDCDGNQIVQLNNYTDSSNPYVFPYDGYISLESGSSDSGYIRVVIRSPSGEVQPYMYMNVTASFQVQSMFVKKGMKAYVLANTVQSSTIKYYPLTK